MAKTDGNITVDSAYEAVAPDDFAAMMDVDRYGQRSTAFNKIISATHDHFWDPMDTKYIDFSTPFDMENEYLVDPSQNTDLKTAVKDKLDEKQKIKLVNLDVQWSLSSILHGEAGALALSASLCHIPQGSGRAGICGEPDPRGSPPRRRFLELHQGPLGQAGESRPGARRYRHRTGALPPRLEKDRRHADAGRRSGHGCLRNLLQEWPRPADGAAHAAHHDG
ncbi:MAG: hypothetical protein PW790_09060 [Parvibaculaceae bacterium]|nr:hypothetical protein [Parvibaculaceae bacterium]